jgi:hypothetical protein
MSCTDGSKDTVYLAGYVIKNTYLEYFFKSVFISSFILDEAGVGQSVLRRATGYTVRARNFSLLPSPGALPASFIRRSKSAEV